MTTEAQRVTLRRVAELSRVSVSTASRALRDHPHVNAKTKESVQNVAASLGYRSNAVARSLVTGRSDVVAFMAYASPGCDYGFWADMARVARERLEKLGLLLVTCLGDDTSDSEARLLDSLIGQLVAGILWVPTVEADLTSLCTAILPTRTPVVILDRTRADCPATFVRNDDFSGARAAARHVIRAGRRRLGLLIGAPPLYTMAWRRDGYLAAIDEAGIPRSDVQVAETGYSYREAHGTARRVLSREPRPTAVLATTDEQAWGVLVAASELGLRVPEDLRVIGYGDYLPSHYTRCALTTVSQRGESVMTRAVEALAEEMKGEHLAEHREIVVPTQLIVRET